MHLGISALHRLGRITGVNDVILVSSLGPNLAVFQAMLAKSIWKWLKRIFLILILLLLIAGISANIPAVQTWMAQKLTDRLSEDLGTAVRIERVYLKFLNSAELRGFYMEDLHNDTLFYLEKFQLNVKSVQWRARSVHIGKVRLDGMVYKLNRYADRDRFDQALILEQLLGDRSSEGGDTRVLVDDIILQNARWHFRDALDKTIKPQQVDPLDLRLTDLLVSADEIKLGSAQLQGNSPDYELVLNSESFRLHDDDLHFSSLELQMNESKLQGSGDLSLRTDSSWFSFPVVEIKIDPSDVEYITDRLPEGLKSIELRGGLKNDGHVYSSNGMDVHYGKSSRFIAEGKLSDPKEEDFSYELIVHPSRILSQDLGVLRKFDIADIPDRFMRVGVIRFEGDVEGDRKALLGTLDVSSNIGSIRANIETSYKDSIDNLEYTGDIHMTDFDLGYATGLKEFETFSADLEIDGSGIRTDNFKTWARGELRDLEVRGESLDRIELDGRLSYDMYEGRMDVEDDNADLHFDGKYGTNSGDLIFSFEADVRSIDLSAFGVFHPDSKAVLSTFVEADFIGDDIESFRGTVDLTGNAFETNRDFHFVNDLHIKVFDSLENRYTYVSSDIINLQLIGKYRYGTIIPSIQSTVNSYLGIEDESQKKSEFDLSVQINDANPITRIWYPDLELGHGIKLEVKHRSDSRMLWGRLELPAVRMGKNYLQNALVGVSRAQNGLMLTQDIEVVGRTGTDEISDFLARQEIRNEEVGYEVMWDPDTVLNYKTYLSGTIWYKDSFWNHRTSEGWFVFKDSLWKWQPDLEQAYNPSGEWSVDSMRLFTESQSVGISGIVSDAPSDVLNLNFVNTELAIANNWIKDKNTRLSGKIDGKAGIHDLYGKPYIVSDLAVDSLFFNKEFLGKLDLSTDWGQADSSIRLQAHLHRQGVNALVISGGFHPYATAFKMDLTASFEKFKLYVLSKYTEDFLTDLRGLADGNVHILVSPSKNTLTGELNLSKVSFKEPLTNVYYNLDGSHKVELNERGIFFDDITILDTEHGTSGMVSGNFMHDNLRDWAMDLNIDADNLFVMNTNLTHSQYYYGTLWATGGLRVEGPLNDLMVTIDARGDDGSKFSLPLNSSSEVGNNSFVTFISKEERSGLALEEGRRSVKRSGFEMDMQVSADEGTEIELIFDETVGDILRARGTGDIRIGVSKEGNIEMSGEYIIHRGDYLFTLQNILNKRFTLQRGGSIRWTGDPYDADLDLITTYKLRTDLKPLGVSDSTRRYWVYVDLKMGNKLSRPTLAFEVRLPDANRNIQQEVEDVITSTPDELNRQVFSLLVMNSFLTPEYAGNAITNSGNEGYLSEGVSANTAEILSNQLSHWVSKLSDDFDLGVNYEQGGDLAPDQVELALSTQLFDDRVSLNGNVGVPVNSPETSQIVGDVEVEVKISKDGNFRVKAFNRSTEFESLDNRYGYMQGIGLVYQASFSNFEELKEILFKRKKRSSEDEDVQDESPGEPMDEPSKGKEEGVEGEKSPRN
jgi:hypothetical protein